MIERTKSNGKRIVEIPPPPDAVIDEVFRVKGDAIRRAWREAAENMQTESSNE